MSLLSPYSLLDESVCLQNDQVESSAFVYKMIALFFSTSLITFVFPWFSGGVSRKRADLLHQMKEGRAHWRIPQKLAFRCPKQLFQRFPVSHIATKVVVPANVCDAFPSLV